MWQTPTHVCLIKDFCPGGELFALLDRQPMKVFKEEAGWKVRIGESHKIGFSPFTLGDAVL